MIPSILKKIYIVYFCPKHIKLISIFIKQIITFIFSSVFKGNKQSNIRLYLSDITLIKYYSLNELNISIFPIHKLKV